MHKKILTTLEYNDNIKRKGSFVKFRNSWWTMAKSGFNAFVVAARRAKKRRSA